MRRKDRWKSDLVLISSSSVLVFLFSSWTNLFVLAAKNFNILLLAFTNQPPDLEINIWVIPDVRWWKLYNSGLLSLPYNPTFHLTPPLQVPFVTVEDWAIISSRWRIWLICFWNSPLSLRFWSERSQIQPVSDSFLVPNGSINHGVCGQLWLIPDTSHSGLQRLHHRPFVSH